MRTRWLTAILFFLPSTASAQLVISANLSGVVNAPIDQNGWQSFKVNLTQNVTFNFVVAPPAPLPAQSTLRVIFTQDATGGRTVTFASNIANACTVSATANATTTCQFTFDGTTSTWQGVGGSSGGGSGVVGGTFGGSPSSGYTFTSTPIVTAPFSGDWMEGCAILANNTGTWTAGTGWTLDTSTASIALEHQTAGSATSYSAAFGYSIASGNWGGVIETFSPSGTPTKVQATSGDAITALAYTSNNGAGNLLTACIEYNTSLNTGPVSSITDTNSNTWKLGGRRAPNGYNKGAGDGNFLEFWYAFGSVAGANTVTTHGLTGTTGNHMAIAETSGVQTSGFPVDYNFTGSTTSVTSIPGATTNSQYIINAVNNVTGLIDSLGGTNPGRDSASIERAAAAANATPGAQFLFKRGIFPCQTSVQETNNSQSTWYCNATAPSPSGGATQAAWHIIGESFTQPSGAGGAATVDLNGVVTLVLPSAYSGPGPGGGTLRAWYARPAPASVNNSIFLINHACYIPDNQASPTGCYDTSQATFSYHENLIMGTVTPAIDQLCSGLIQAQVGMVGLTSNNFGTNESFFENIWGFGWDTAYNIISNHPVGINMHASCGNIPAKLNIQGSLYGGWFTHFQDIHNINGMVLTCQPGTRFDLMNTILENAQSGTFARVAGATEGNVGNCVGHVDVTTGSANNVAFNPSPFFASGNGTNMRVNESTRLLQPGLVTSNFTSAATTGTTKQTLATYSFVYQNTAPGPALGPFINNPGATFRIKAWGITAANTNSKTFEIDFGGTAIATITTGATTTSGTVRCEAEIIVSSVANTQEVTGQCFYDDGTTRTNNTIRTAPGITGNANIALNIAATTPTASGDLTFKGLTIEYVGGQ